MKLYHSTSAAAAREILRHGFKDGTLCDFLRAEDASRAVSLLDAPADENEGATSSQACIEVDVPDKVACTFEVLMEVLPDDPKDPDQPADANWIVAEWAIPAHLLNNYPRRLLSHSERNETPVMVRKYRRL